MSEDLVNRALDAVGEDDLARLGRAASRLRLGRLTRPGGGRHSGRRAGVGREFLEFRSYVAGDELRQIDWRASVRSRRLQVRRHLDEASARWLVCLDGSSSMTAPAADKWLLALQLAAAWVYLLLSAGHRVGLLQFDGTVREACPPASGRQQFQRVASHLRGAVLPPEGLATDLGACAPWVGPAGCAVVLSDFLAPDALCPGLDAIAAQGGEVHAVQVLASAECPALPRETVAMRDVETGAERTLLGSTEGTDSARTRLGRLCSHLADHCAHRGVFLSDCRSDQAWREVMLRHLLALRGTRA